MMKIAIRNARVRVHARYHRAGSILAGTATAGCDSVRTEVDLDSDEPIGRVSELLRMAEASCYTIGAIREPTPCELVASVNGKPLEIAREA
ncbi:MAG TPA: hypothetical protein VFC51_08210 [Chloroflexota bacterium]|nr:hypothetical protein [Chloroflexota bacterium]